MRIPVFVSSPTALSPDQERSRKVVIDLLDRYKMEPRALGRSDYPKDFPLKEVLIIAKHCHGGVVLGFEQMLIKSATFKAGTKNQSELSGGQQRHLPTPWNHLESGILFGLRLPLLVFKEIGIEGGIFDPGTSEAFLHEMPPNKPSREKRDELEHVFLKWSAAVQAHYEAF
jgi:hypothetical protein